MADAIARMLNDDGYAADWRRPRRRARRDISLGPRPRAASTRPTTRPSTPAAGRPQSA